MAKQSAGILLYRNEPTGIAVLLVCERLQEQDFDDTSDPAAVFGCEQKAFQQR